MGGEIEAGLQGNVVDITIDSQCPFHSRGLV